MNDPMNHKFFEGKAWVPATVYDALEARLEAALEALRLARGYVEAVHTSTAKAMGHERTLVRPDLDKIDAVLAKERP